MTNSPIRKASLADQVEQILNERIQEGLYPPGGKMPTEEQLAEEFDVSRATIRAAFNAMTASHIIVRRHGVGTFVSQAAKLSNQLDQSIDFLELIASGGFAPGFKELFSRIVIPNEEVRDKLDLDENHPVLEVHKVFSADGNPVIYSQNYIPSWVYRAGLTDDEAVAMGATEPFFGFFRDICKHELQYYLSDVYVGMPSDYPYIIEAMHVTEETPILVIDEVGFDRQDKSVNYAIEYLRGYHMQFSLVRKCQSTSENKSNGKGDKMQSNWLPEIVNRSENGPYMKESEYDLTLAKAVMKLVGEYELKYDPNTLVPSDDDLSDRLYQASLDLFVEMGVYNQSTQRRILFTRQEVEDAVAAAPSSVVLGTGKDAVVERHREIEDMEPCCMHSGPTGTPTSEEYHGLILQSCAQEPLVDCLGHGSVSTYQGHMIIPGTPLEILAAQRDAVQAREAIRKAGRPGMHIEDMAVPLTCAGKIATFMPENGMRPSDGLLVSQIPEIKTDYDQLSRVAYLSSMDMHIVDLMTPLIGGLGGGAQGTAIVTVASHLLGVICYAVSYHFMGHMSLQWSHNTGPMGLWVQAAAGQALARNTPVVSINDLYPRSGLGTKELFWEVAAGAMVGAVCGLHQHGIGATGGSLTDHTSGLEARFQAEVAHATLGKTRAEVNQLVLACLEKYQDTLAEPNLGKSFPELYDLETLEPNQEWLDIYEQVRLELSTMGLDMDNGWKEALKLRYAAI